MCTNILAFTSLQDCLLFVCRDLANRAKNALVCVLQKLYLLNNSSLEVFLKLFDAQVQPIAQYGSELWGLDKAAIYIEKVHLYALKRFLGVDMKTPNDPVHGETDRFPITLNSAVRCIRYWLKLTCMGEDKLPHKAYMMLYNLDARVRETGFQMLKCNCMDESRCGKSEWVYTRFS